MFPKCLALFALLLGLGSQASATATASAAASHSSHAPAVSVDPEQSLKWLKNGNRRFLKGFLRKDGQSHRDVARLSTGQQPHAIVLSCSDSRVPPEIVFDQKLGEIFTVRTAGEALNDNAVGSIEYAVEHLGARLIIVMGHTSCGAVKAALGTLDGKDAGSPALNGLVRDLHPHLQSFKGKTPSKDVEAESLANVNGVTADLLVRSEILRSRWKKGELKFQSALYHLDSGVVDFPERVSPRVPASSGR
ncbi:MAG: hypothetical protein KF802_15925 [Bdellovibrionaceae bacterium]|nr:hypothetical protein [Pseudobdellovibrionaceae bacterium]MBX3035056.1 hypothetical protein [Pseudobdellovibrionaceae bacterium]